MNKIVYLDNNASVRMNPVIANFMMKHIAYGNPQSGKNSLSLYSNKLIEKTKKMIFEITGYNENDYSLLFNSGASEGNSHVIKEFVRAYKLKNAKIPTILINSTEHKSIHGLTEEMEQNKEIKLIYIKPDFLGGINVDSFKNIIYNNPDISMVCIMHANNETGVINNIGAISNICHENNIWFHCDCVQTFGKIKIPHATSISTSLHKLGGPCGAGILLINKNYVKHYDFKSLIYGSQNENLRGGTYSVFMISGIYSCLYLTYYFKNNKQDNYNYVLKLRNYLLYKLMRSFKNRFIIPNNENYQLIKQEIYNKEDISNPLKKCGIYCYVLYPNMINDNIFLHNTVSITFVYFSETEKLILSKNDIQSYLSDYGIIIGIGSACNIGKNYSHVFKDYCNDIKIGTIRISLCLDNNKNDIKQLIKCLKKYFNENNFKIC